MNAQKIRLQKYRDEDTEGEVVYWVIAGNGQELGFVEKFGKKDWEARCPEGWPFGFTASRKGAVAKVLGGYVWDETRGKHLTHKENDWNQLVASIKANNERNAKPEPIYTDEMTDEEIAALIVQRLGR